VGKPNLKISEHCKQSHTIEFELSGVNDERWFLLSSDRHHDSMHCDWDLEKKHLDEAVRRGAGIIDLGDLYDAMQGKWDVRSNRDACRPEHQHGNYLDRLVETATDFYKPYAENMLLLCPGNHETAIMKRHETSLTERLCERLRLHGGSNLYVGSYSGFVRFQGKRKGTRASSKIVMGRHHGYGGGGPVTRGTIQTARMANYLPDCQLIVSGHTHDDWRLTIARSRINHVGTPYIDHQTHCRPPGYKDEYGPGDGWAIERGHPPKTKGALWVRFFLERPPGSNDTKLAFEVQEAK